MSVANKITDAITGEGLQQPVPEVKKNAPLLVFDSFMQPTIDAQTNSVKPPLLSPFELISKELANTKKEEGALNEMQINQVENTENIPSSIDMQYALENLEKADLLPSKDKDLIMKVLGYVGQGEVEMEQVKRKLFEMSKDPQSMNAGHMMLVQMEMAKAMHKIEFASVIMSNAVTSLKSVFNNPL